MTDKIKPHGQPDKATGTAQDKPERGVWGQIYDKLFPGPRKNRLYRVLCIDGGGIRGIIPAHVLAEIEERMGKPISECFDMIVGTSTGGIVALGLACPDPENPTKPRYTAQQIVESYHQLGPITFPAKPFSSARQILRPKYETAPLKRELEKLFGDTTIHEALTGVLIPAGDHERMETLLMRHRGPGHQNDKDDLNFRMVDALLGTTAAPTYFEPAEIFSIPRGPRERKQRFSLLDGALFANHPAMFGLMEALVNRDQKASEDIMVVSIGTGDWRSSYKREDIKKWRLHNWVHPGLDVPLLQFLISFQSDAADQFLQKLLGEERYFRIEEQEVDPHLPQSARPSKQIDDASEDNLKKLDAYAQALIRKNTDQIDRVCTMLREDLQRYPRQKPPAGGFKKFFGFGNWNSNQVSDAENTPPTDPPASGLLSVSSGDLTDKPDMHRLSPESYSFSSATYAISCARDSQKALTAKTLVAQSDLKKVKTRKSAPRPNSEGQKQPENGKNSGFMQRFLKKKSPKTPKP